MRKDLLRLPLGYCGVVWSSELMDLQRALEIAIEAHKGAKDKGGNDCCYSSWRYWRYQIVVWRFRKRGVF